MGAVFEEDVLDARVLELKRTPRPVLMKEFRVREPGEKSWDARQNGG
jgi:hypothetical protein